MRAQLIVMIEEVHNRSLLDGPCPTVTDPWPRQMRAPDHERMRRTCTCYPESDPSRLMAPVPTTIQSLTTRLTALSESNKALGQLIQRLAKLDFQPGSQPLGTEEEGDVRLELSAEIHESLKGIEEDLELLRQEVEDVIEAGNTSARRRESKTEGERSRLAVLLARLTEDLKSYASHSLNLCGSNLELTAATGQEHSSARRN